MLKRFSVLCAAFLAVLALLACGPAAPAAPTAPTASTAPATPSTPTTLTIASTTSTYDSGLFEFVLSPFEKSHNVKIKVVAVGTGEALELGKRGDAELLVVHAPQSEQQFMDAGYGVYYKPLWYNDFVLLGPSQDPAGVRGMKDAAQALLGIAGKEAIFVSRGDNSGTHQLEKQLWTVAGKTPSGPWYLSAGQGMGETLTLANEKGGYTLSDRATYLKWRSKIRLELVVEGDVRLKNFYHAMIVDPKRYPQVKYDMAKQLIDYFTSEALQKSLQDFGKADYGQALFTPNSEEWTASKKATPVGSGR
ncbi:MAG TPA: substrate-binding domain-containing protein [Dehalococcoidia bacterium]|nr:substrate-binding domain-containing protein [Dehalococcoidia bacterium]